MEQRCTTITQHTKNRTQYDIPCVNKGKIFVPVSGPEIQVSPHCTRNKTSGIPSRQEAVWLKLTRETNEDETYATYKKKLHMRSWNKKCAEKRYSLKYLRQNVITCQCTSLYRVSEKQKVVMT